eukprot:907696-Amphidinium_carterae.1
MVRAFVVWVGHSTLRSCTSKEYIGKIDKLIGVKESDTGTWCQAYISTAKGFQHEAIPQKTESPKDQKPSELQFSRGG